MRAAWYERTGDAESVLTVGEMPTPEPGDGEVRVRVHLPGVNPGDTKKRLGWQDGAMPYPRVVPHSDAAGVIDAVGPDVDADRVGRRVWVHGAQSYRAFGTAAEYVVVPDDLAVALPDEVPDELGACLGIPGITAHRAVFADGPLADSVVLVHGVLGGVGRLAAQLARRAGALVVGTVRSSGDVPAAAEIVDHVVALDTDDPAGAIRRIAPEGVDRVVEVSLSDNVRLDAAVTALGGVVVAYASRDGEPSIPFWPMLFANLTLRLVGSDDVPVEAKRAAAAELTQAAREGALHVPAVDPLPLADIARAHELVDAGSRRRVLLDPRR
ncbi:NADPH:quinone reductase [Agilicoccus flavus]|uniref:NADPH:quinone reductase n=1 Tax=Agilicoccus flavus TaxID=2775968 RepID=UPI001CF6B736|nr:NADPH:quinone reductase [Agilicoccus flavus]